MKKLVLGVNEEVNYSVGDEVTIKKKGQRPLIVQVLSIDNDWNVVGSKQEENERELLRAAEHVVLNDSELGDESHLYSLKDGKSAL